MTNLSPEEKHAVTALVRSQGWSVLMRHLLYPDVQRATERIDSVAVVSEKQMDVMRGIKYQCLRIVKEVYMAAGITNPFDRSALALLADLTPESLDAPSAEDPTPDKGSALPRERPARRANYPI